MSVSYHAPKVEAAGLTLRAGFGVENTSGQQLSIGYHIFDPETDTLVVDGPRTKLEAQMEMSLELPPEPGRYRVFVSPMEENVAWYYERGWRFLLIDAIVAEGRATVESFRITTQKTVARERIRRTAGRVFTLPVRTIWRNRSLIRTMVRRDIVSRYRGSFGGALWTVMTPLLLMLTYFFVFGVVLGARFENDPSRSGFVLYFFAGMLPWLAFSEAAGRAPTVVWEHRNFVKKLVFPVETLPVNLAASGLVTECVMLLLFVVALLIAKGHVPATVAWLPVVVAPQVLFTLGVCWFLAALGVFVRDLGQLMGFLLTLWFFLTPICYPETQLSAEAMAVLSKNPIFTMVRLYRTILLEGANPAVWTVVRLWAMSLVVFFGGYAWFYKLRKSFADIV